MAWPYTMFHLQAMPMRHSFWMNKNVRFHHSFDWRHNVIETPDTAQTRASIVSSSCAHLRRKLVVSLTKMPTTLFISHAPAQPRPHQHCVFAPYTKYNIHYDFVQHPRWSRIFLAIFAYTSHHLNRFSSLTLRPLFDHPGSGSNTKYAIFPPKRHVKKALSHG